MDTLREVIPELPPPIAKTDDAFSDEFSTFLEDTIAPIALKAERSIEQEQLQEADTMYRVPVPVMDFSLPLAPWKISAASFGDKKIREIKLTLLELKNSHFSKHHWPGVGETERTLQWMSFPSALGRVETYESIGDDSVTKEYLEVSESVDHGALTWKPEGLRVLDDLWDSDEEELPFGDFPVAEDIASLVKKRKRELEHEIQSDAENDEDPFWLPHERQVPVNHEAFRNVPELPPQKTRLTEQIHQSNRTLPTEKPGSAIDQAFSALASLENFINLRTLGSKKMKVTAEHHFSKKDSVSKPNSKAPREPLQKAQIDKPEENKIVPAPLVAPQFTASDAPTPVVVSTTILQDRKVIRHIQQLLPSIDFIERDFSLHSAPQRPNCKNSTAAANVPSSTADEADIILSPSVGMILTTLQKIKQRPLPGQATKSALRERITRVAPRYEKLILLLTTDQLGASTLDNSDCAALVDFTSFTTTIHDEIQVLLCANDPDNLARWVASLVMKHSIQNPDVKLLQDETLWEIFLRRAGMNAFAAQVILLELKAPASSGQDGELAADGEGADHGLTAFVKMSSPERLTRFEMLLGGRRMIERVSRVLDAPW